MSVQISASDVNKLRQQTGAGMMDCKKALVEANGDFEAAVDYLRKKGAKVAASRQDRDSNEGVIIAKAAGDGKSGIVVEVNCETDFVAKNADFIAFAESVADVALANKPTSLDDLKALEIGGAKIADLLIDQTGKIGEKIEVSKYETISAEKVVAYIHANYRLGVLVGLSADADGVEEAGKDVAMQIAAMNPIAIDKDGVDQHTIDREIAIAKEQIIAEGKPAEMAEKIAAGKLNKFYKETTLLNQEFVKDSSKNISQFLDSVSKGLTVTAFKRVQLGA
ncbi:elongation factor Ts [Sphingobacterium olei]|uniref:Elongation factor Ts n=1 Tax=Sphingobacterium olei TaxID=2571155 RepID=A0A4U0P269_9SPHI|nr:translation elongation factor Ts [Sphingobacterium olei]TJZ61387.1 elongation factor Ts [Sphingobacterium olei]